jgi:hypothetical protein
MEGICPACGFALTKHTQGKCPRPCIVDITTFDDYFDDEAIAPGDLIDPEDQSWNLWPSGFEGMEYRRVDD